MRVVIGCLLMVLWVSAVLLLPGCGPSEADASQAAVPRELSFTVINNTGGEMRSIGLEGANLPIAFSNIAEADRHTLKSKNLELPETLTLHWSDARGDRREGTVEVWGELGSSYSGPVNLTVTQRGKVVLTGG
ncbi:MAG: hypothetical protein ACE37H_13050 [Phycisphaeraceae bacterium]